MHSDENFRELRRASARLVARGDQELQAFKSVYRTWSKLEQMQFREALKRLAEANDILNKLPPHVKAWVETHWESRDLNSGEVLAGGRGKLTPQILLKAIKTWEQGDDYTPGGLAFSSR
jgi:hypothetical protein